MANPHTYHILHFQNYSYLKTPTIYPQNQPLPYNFPHPFFSHNMFSSISKKDLSHFPIFQFYFNKMEVDSRAVNQQVNHDDHYLVLHNKTLKCVCQLCTCGKHHCPRPRIKGNFTTSYGDHYKDIKIAPSNSPPQQFKYEQRHYNPEALKTNYQETYTPQKMNTLVDSPSKLESYGSKILYQVPFVGQSSYKDQYKPYSIKPAQNPQDDGNIFKSNENPVPYRPTIKFQGVTSYKSHYVEPPKVQSKLIPQATYQKAQVPFYGSSSYKKDFPQYKIEPKATIQDPTPNYRPPQVKFQGSTSYNDQYKAYQNRIPENDLAQSRHTCLIQKLHVPPVNYINDKNHIYYDPEKKQFV